MELKTIVRILVATGMTEAKAVDTGRRILAELEPPVVHVLPAKRPERLTAA